MLRYFVLLFAKTMITSQEVLKLKRLVRRNALQNFQGGQTVRHSCKVNLRLLAERNGEQLYFHNLSLFQNSSPFVLLQLLRPEFIASLHKLYQMPLFFFTLIDLIRPVLSWGAFHIHPVEENNQW